MKTAKLLDRVFPPFSDVAREKPRDMLFIADEKPDMLTICADHGSGILQ